MDAADDNPVPTEVAATSSPDALRYPEVYAFFGSGCLLVLELVAGRLLAPTIGVSLYTWTSIIGVVLAGVALGNFVGGRLADRHPTRGMLGLLFLLASLSSLLILGLISIVDSIQLPSETPAVLQVVWLCAVMFFLPAAILGAITPLLTRIALHSLDSTGRVVGRIQAFATLGSIIGTFLTGFVLISLFGTRAIVAGVAALLLIMAIAARPPWMRKPAAAVLVAMVALATLGAGATIQSGCTRETNYFCIVSADSADSSGHFLKLLRLDSLVHGITDLDEPTRLAYGYTAQYADILSKLHAPGDKVDTFEMGGGAYSLARYLDLTYAGRVLVAEIDPGVTDIVRQDFGIPPVGQTRIETINDDARRVLIQMDPSARFDVIFGDAFNDFGVPYQLTTREFARIVASHLKADGVYLMNIIDGVDHDFLRSEITTLRQVFPYVAISPKKEGTWPPDGTRSTFVVVAAMKAPEVVIPTLDQAAMNDFVNQRGATVLTDDHAPVDQLLAPVFSQSLQAQS